MFEIQDILENNFFKTCLKNEIDATNIADLCLLIQVPFELNSSFRNFRLVINRLKKVMPIACNMNSNLEDKWINKWEPCLKSLSNNSEESWFKNITPILTKSKANSFHNMGSNLNGHEYYAALTITTNNVENEEYLVNALAVLFTINTLSSNNDFSASPKFISVCEGLCRSSAPSTVWSEILAAIFSKKYVPENTTTYLIELAGTCAALLSDSTNKQYKEKHKSFLRSFSSFAKTLANNIKLTTEQPQEPLTPTPQPRNPKLPKKSPGSDGISLDPINIPLLLPTVLVHKPRKTENFGTDGLAPEDIEIWITTVGTGEVKKEESPLSEEGVKAELINNQYATDIDNQYLPVRWDSLNSHEISELLNFITSATNEETTHHTKVNALLIALTLATGKKLVEILNMQLVGLIDRDSLELNANSSILFKDHDNHFYWQHEIPFLENKFKPTHEQAKYLNLTTDSLTLPLPKVIDSLLKQVVSENNSPRALATVIGLSTDLIEENISEQYKKFRASRKNRSTLARTRHVIFDSMMRINADEISAITILGLNFQRPLAGLYYTSFLTQDLQSLYCSATELIFNSSQSKQITDYISSENTELGSLLTIRSSIIINFVNELKARCDATLGGRRNLSKIITAHNHYVTYTLMLLFFSSGHRSVNDPFCDPHCFIEDLKAVLITDKVELPEHEGRVSWLGNTAWGQYHAYLEHLQGLYSAITQYNPDLACAIQELTNPACIDKKVPLFFYLSTTTWESVRPANLKQELGSLWKLPLNYNRHFIATNLRRAGVPSEYISYHLGHAQTGQSAFGQFSNLSPKGVGETIRKALTSLEKEHDWKVIKGFRPYKQETHQTEISKNWRDVEFGPGLRKTKKEERALSDKETIKSAIKTVQKEDSWEISNEIPEQFIDKVLIKIAEFSNNDPSRYIRQHNIFRRFLRSGRYKHNWQTKIPSLKVEVKGEISPLNYSDGKSIAFLQQIKTQYIQSLLQKFQSDEFPPVADNSLALKEFFSYCQLSSVLFGQLCSVNKVNQIPAAIVKNTQIYKNSIWVNFYHTQKDKLQKLHYRWFPDELTTVLIIRLHKSLTQEELTLSTTSEMTKSTNRLLTNLIKQSEVQAINIGEWNLEHLIHVVKKENALHFPGFMRGIINEDIQTWSLKESAWFRLLGGSPVSNTQESLHEPTLLASKTYQPREMISPLLSKDKSGLAELIYLLRQAQDISSGNNPNPSDIRDYSQRKKALIIQLKDWGHAHNNNISATLFYLYSWLTHLIKKGTRTKSTLKLSSILTYFRANSTALIEQSQGIDLVEIGDDGVFFLYEKVLQYAVESARPYRAERLEEFHTYLIQMHGAPEVDFYELAPTRYEYGADANLVTPAEYTNAFNLLLQDSHYDETGQLIHVLMLCLMYRNGLRPSEVVRLLLSDILTGDDCLVYVRNNRYGLCKSVNGVRQIPLLSRLNSDEQKLLARWESIRKQQENNNALSPFFNRSLHDNSIVVRTTVLTRITQALRIVTGDDNINLRHLRHSFATYYILSASGYNESNLSLQISDWRGYSDTSGENFTAEIFGLKVPTRRILYQLSNFMGHGNLKVTLQHYVHCSDLLLEQFRPPIPKTLSTEDIAKLLNYKESSFSVILDRKKLSKKSVQLRDVLPHYLKKAPENLRILVPKKIKPPTGLPDIKVTKIETPKLDDLASIMILFGEGIGLGKIAERFIFSPEIIQQWLDNAIKIEQETGYKRFNLSYLCSTSPWPLLNEEKEANPLPSITRVRNFIDPLFVTLLEQNLKNTDQSALKELTSIWKYSYKPGKTGFYTPREDQAVRLIELFTQFGLDKENIYLDVPENLHVQVTENKEKWEAWMKEQGVPTNNLHLISGSAVHRSDKSYVPYPVVGISIRQLTYDANQTPKLHGTVEFFNFYLFLASILVTS